MKLKPWKAAEEARPNGARARAARASKEAEAKAGGQEKGSVGRKLLWLGFAILVGYATAKRIPEIRRYLGMESM